MTEIAAIIEEEKEYDPQEYAQGVETTFLQEYDFAGRDDDGGVNPYHVHGALPIEDFEEDPIKDSLAMSRNVQAEINQTTKENFATLYQSHYFESGAGQDYDMIIPSLGMSGTFKKGHLKMAMNSQDKAFIKEAHTINYEVELEGKRFSSKQADMKKRAHILAQTAEGLADIDISADMESATTCFKREEKKHQTAKRFKRSKLQQLPEETSVDRTVARSTIFTNHNLSIKVDEDDLVMQNHQKDEGDY